MLSTGVRLVGIEMAAKFGIGGCAGGDWNLTLFFCFLMAGSVV